jgi:hypothetical protein
VTVPLCTVSILPGTATKGALYKSEKGLATSEDDIQVTSIALDFEYTTSGFGCAAIGLPKSGKDADYWDVITFKGYEDFGGPTKEDEYTEGKQTGIWVTEG